VAYLVPEERGPRGISSISVQQTRLACLGSSDIANLKALCSELRKHVDVLIEQEKIKVLEAAKKIPIDQPYTQEDPPPGLAKKKDVIKSRKKLK